MHSIHCGGSLPGTGDISAPVHLRRRNERVNENTEKGGTMKGKNCGRRQFLKLNSLGAAALFFGKRSGAEARKKRPPNVILVMPDDQGYGDLGCHGNSSIKTPNLDRLHAESVRLTNFHVSPTCAPTRAALMTGRYNSRTGVWHTIMGRSLLRKDEVTMADVFAAAGYRTGIFGKWHLGDCHPFRPQDRGFHESVVHGGGGVTQTPDFWGNDYFDDTYWHNGTPQKYTGYCTDVFFNEAMRFIDENRSRPFFCYLPPNAAHSPYLVPKKYVELYKDKPVPNAAFYGMITNIDENMGRLEKKLNELGIAGNTILIFITDNGTASGYGRRGGKEIGHNGGLRGTKGSQYDGGHRVPFFIRWPRGGLTGKKDINHVAAHIDVLPTLASLCGVKLPEGLDLDGADLSPLLKGTAKKWPDRAIVVESQRIEHPKKWRRCAVMTDTWRLVDGKKLYAMPKDRAQKNDVAAKHPEVVKRLRDAYERWWKHVSARFDEYCRIILGGKQNPTHFTAHDWHGNQVPWNQGMIRNERLMANGFWAVEIERDGRYEFTLRRWPVSAKKPIGDAKKARIQIAEADITKEVPKGAEKMTFTIPLQKGEAFLKTWLLYEGGKSRGAYYVAVRRV